MKTLLLLRHAKSSRDDPALRDHDRPLANRGRKDAPRAGEQLAKQHLLPDRILCSTALRARQTAAAAASAAGYRGEITYLDSLYAANPAAYLAALSELPAGVGTALAVGHNPDLIDLIELLTGAAEDMPTCALAHLRLPIDDWHRINAQIRAELVSVWKPKED